MPICKLCQEKEADRKNTHYLTDAIIRSCLNHNGGNIRETGMMFDISNNRSGIQARFQRSTSAAVIEETFGRAPTEEEIKRAKEIPYSVDYVFCTGCEDIFTAIEQDFLKQVLPKLRGHDFKGTPELNFDESIIIRRFFLLQVYRTSICDPGFKISNDFQEKLRKLIYSTKSDLDQLASVPLNVIYLNTVGDDFEYTRNTVGIASWDDNSLIIFNDFIIQAFDNVENVKYVDFLGFNDPKTFAYFTNYRENQFKFRVTDHETKVKLWKAYSDKKAEQERAFYRRIFINAYMERYNKFPPVALLEAFVNEIIFGESVSDESRYSIERVNKIKEIMLNA